MSPNTGECIINSPKEVIVYNHFPQWSKNRVMKKKGTKDGEYWSVTFFMCVDSTYFPYLLYTPKLEGRTLVDKLHTTS